MTAVPLKLPSEELVLNTILLALRKAYNRGLRTLIMKSIPIEGADIPLCFADSGEMV